MSKEIYLAIFLGLVALAVALYFFSTRSNVDISSMTEDSVTIGKILSAIRNINNRLDILERRYSLDKEQSERARKNILEGMSLATEARRLDNIAVTGLLDRTAFTGTTTTTTSTG